MAAKYPGLWLCVNGLTHGNAHKAVWGSVMKTWLQNPTHTSRCKLEKDGKKGRTTKCDLWAPWLLPFLYIILYLCFLLTSCVCVRRDEAVRLDFYRQFRLSFIKRSQSGVLTSSDPNLRLIWSCVSCSMWVFNRRSQFHWLKEAELV